MRIFLAALFFVLAVSPAQAANRCYSLAEVKAEKLLRLHSELMVITVTCKQSSIGRDLVKAYTGFTNRYVELIRGAESTLSHYYAATYGGDGVTRLDTLRTRLANEYGQEIAAMSAPAFCAQRRDKVIAMYDNPPASVQEDSMRTYASAMTYEPVCDKSLKVAESAVLPETTGDSHTKEADLRAKKTKKKAKI